METERECVLRKQGANCRKIPLTHQQCTSTLCNIPIRDHNLMKGN